MTKVLICGTQRSGTTMICDDLTRLGVGRPNEHFNTWIDDARQVWPAAFETLNAEATANGIQASKIMSNQIRTVETRFATFVSPLDDGRPYPCLRAAYRDTIWIWARRRDQIAQAVSFYLANASGVFHNVTLPYGQGGFVPGATVLARNAHFRIPEVPYDFEAILRALIFVQRGDAVWSEFFAITGIEPRIWTYEDYVFDFATALAEELGRPPTPSTDRNLEKLPSGRSAEMRRRFAEDFINTEFDDTFGATPLETIARTIYDAVPTTHVDLGDHGLVKGPPHTVPWHDLPRVGREDLVEKNMERARAVIRLTGRS